MYRLNSKTTKKSQFSSAKALLSSFITAIFICAVISLATYIYVLINHSLSEHRRIMNSAIYDVQLYFDQREVLVRALAANVIQLPKSALSNSDNDSIEQSPFTALPFSENAKDRWGILLTPRLKNAINRVGKLVYIETNPDLMAILSNHRPNKWQIIDDKLLTSDFSLWPNLSKQENKVVWQSNKVNSNYKITAYSYILGTKPYKKWLGLEFKDVEKIIKPLPLPGKTSFALFDKNSDLLLGNKMPKEIIDIVQSKQDYYGLTNFNLLNSQIILSAEIGTNGLKIVYAIPFLNILITNAIKIISAIIIFLLFILGLVFFNKQVKNKILIPMHNQYQELNENLTLTKTIISSAPIGLALISRHNLNIYLANEQARIWMREIHKLKKYLPLKKEKEKITEIDINNNKTIQIKAISLNYNKNPAVLCLIQDTSAEKQIRQKLTEANRAKTDILAMLGHEIRTPLQGVIGSIELLQLPESKEARQAYLKSLKYSATSLLKIVNDAIDLSQIEIGKLKIKNDSFYLFNVIYETISIYRAFANTKHVEIYEIIDPIARQAVIGDAQRLRQVLGNLLSNAIKYTPKGSITIILNGNINNNTMVFSIKVKDTGIGIPENDITKIFDPYFRSNTLSREGGTGLGLTISKMLCNMMGGNINVSSVVGKGTCVAINMILPLDQEADSSYLAPIINNINVYIKGLNQEINNNICSWLNIWGAKALIYSDKQLKNGDVLITLDSKYDQNLSDTQVKVELLNKIQDNNRIADSTYILLTYPTVHDIGTAVQNIKNNITSANPQALINTSSWNKVSTPTRPSNNGFKTVLIVEDNEINLFVIAKQFESLNIMVDMARDGLQALDLFKQSSYFAIITDINMPNMNGHELARHIRMIDKHIPIIGLSAGTIPNKEGLHNSHDIDRYITKPVSVNELIEIVEWIDLTKNDNLYITQVDKTDIVDNDNIEIPSHLVKLFIETTTKDLHDLDTALKSRQEREVKNILHRMKGGFAIVGFHKIIDQLEALEKELGNNKNKNQIFKKVILLKDEIEIYINNLSID